MAAGETLRFCMLFTFDVCQREMAKVHLRRAPRTFPLVGGHRAAKERELGTILGACRVFEHGGEIPPLLAKTRMGTVVARKLERSHPVCNKKPGC